MISFLCQLHIFLAFVRILDNLLFLKCYSMVGWSARRCTDPNRPLHARCIYFFDVYRDCGRSSIDEQRTVSDGRKTNKRTIKCCSISFSCETPEGTRIILLFYIYLFPKWCASVGWRVSFFLSTSWGTRRKRGNMKRERVHHRCASPTNEWKI